MKEKFLSFFVKTPLLLSLGMIVSAHLSRFITQIGENGENLRALLLILKSTQCFAVSECQSEAQEIQFESIKPG